MSLYSRAEKVMRPALCSETAMDLLQEADAEIARLRKSLEAVRDAQLGPDRGSAQFTVTLCAQIAHDALARAALAPVELP